MTGIELMRKDKGGRGGQVINLSSVAGLHHVFALPVYTATKHAVLAFTKSLQNEVFYARTGISFATICPSVTHTPLVGHILESFLWPELLDEAKKVVSSFPTQEPPIVAKCILMAIDDAENGAVWQVESNRIEKIKLHDYQIFL